MWQVVKESVRAHGHLVTLAGEMRTAQKIYFHNDLMDEVQRKQLHILDGEYTGKGTRYHAVCNDVIY